MNPENIEQAIEAKMQSAGLTGPAIQSFLTAVRKVAAGERGMLPEAGINPVESLPRWEDLPQPDTTDALLRQLAVVKLNGGLGTSMGLDRAKSLIPVKGLSNFLDFIARQVLHLRGDQGTEPAFFLMDSFSTHRETLDYLRRYPTLAGGGPLDFLQSKVPKLHAATLAPVAWPCEPELEWCPPGHGDIYPSLVATGLLDQLLGRGVKFMFVSNSDNLGATVELRLLSFFAESGWSFLMEVAERTASDRKGGHLARRRDNGRLLLRESAQCLKSDEPSFQDIERHRYFNTNNLWIRLDHLKMELDRNTGALPLPLITNLKTVDPGDPASPKVLQLESAMGAAIECFERSGAVVVPRARFSPVKTTSDLLALRSDAYVVTEDFRLVLADERKGRPPKVDLDARHCKMLADFERFFPAGAPSLIGCDSLAVTGPVEFDAGVVCTGTVEFVNASCAPKRVARGTYTNTRVEL